VAATLLPLLSFFLLLLAGALRTALRPRAGDHNASSLYLLLGADRPLRAGAYVATGAMAGAFLLSVIGFVLFTKDWERAHVHGGHASAVRQETKNEAKDAEDREAPRSTPEEEQLERRWQGQITWALIQSGAGQSEPATRLSLGYRIDHLTVVMFLMVTFIGGLIHLFSIGYMGDELQPVVEDHQVVTATGHLHRRGRFGRFFLFMSLFSFSMLNLVLADNFFQVFVSWELVGICSYLLIGFYYERQSASNAANKAFITNRVGDAGFIIGVLIIWTFIGSFNFDEVFKQIRSPIRDSHGDNIALGAQIVRADPIPGAEGKRFRVAQPGEGSHVVLFPVNEPEHFHGLEAGLTFNTSKDYQLKNPESPRFRTMPYWLLVLAGLGIFLGCVGKSAQFPLHVWLPDAMEGPTPVSALIHAATMVAAGVYLVGRCYPLFTPESRLVIAYTGGITLFLAATIALVMTDIKKVLAYSTVSQLGYMMLALGVGGWAAGLFHLVTHAFFKALLFLGSGSVIYGCHHEQDMLKMGGLYPKMKTTALTMLIGVLTIAGIPFFSGWYSKDAILAQALGFVIVHKEHLLLFVLPLVTAGLTAFYMFRMWFLTFAGTSRDAHVHEHAHESPQIMTMPLVVLAFFSIVVGWGWPIWNAEKSHLQDLIHHSQHNAVIADFGLTQEEREEGAGAFAAGSGLLRERNYAETNHEIAGSLALLIVGVGVLFAYLMYVGGVLDPAEAKAQFPGTYRFLVNKWYADEVYSAILVRPALRVAGWFRSIDARGIDGLVDGSGRLTVQVARWNGRFDMGIIDGIVNLVAQVTFAIGRWLRRVQTGYIRSYVLFLVMAALAIFAVLSYVIAMAASG
jgi:NADH-quinone oxidoreductase subunit L